MKVIFLFLTFFLMLSLLPGQNIGINTQNPQEHLHIKSDTNRLALRLDSKKSSDDGGYNFFSVEGNPTNVQNLVLNPTWLNWTDLNHNKLDASDDNRLNSPLMELGELTNGLKVNFSLQNSIPSNAEIEDIFLNIEWRRTGTYAGPLTALITMAKASDNSVLATFHTNPWSQVFSSTDVNVQLSRVQILGSITPDLLNLQDFFFILALGSPMNGASRLEMDRISLEVIYKLPATGTESVAWSAGVKNGTFRISNSGDLNNNQFFSIDENGTTQIKTLKIAKNAGSGKVLTSTSDGKAFWADPVVQSDDLIWLSKQDTAYYAEGPVQINNGAGAPALIFDKGATKLNNGINLIETSNRLLNIILDADNNQANEQVNFYKNNDEAMAGSPKVRLNLDNNPSWINGGGNLGIGTINPQQRLSVVGTIRAAFDSTETEYIEMRHGGNHALLNTVGDGKLIFQHDGQHKMTLLDDGKVGIGFLDPVERLDVNGAIKLGNTTNPSPQSGTLRWDESVKKLEYHDGLEWKNLVNQFENNNGVVRPTNGYNINDFVFGAENLPSNANTTDTLFFFDKDKGAFRAGITTISKSWAPDSLGQGSFAHGFNSKAVGDYAFASGYSTSAGGNYAFASGYFSKATATNSVAFGAQSTASGIGAVAAGDQCIASGNNAVALGTENEVTGLNAFALGENNLASHTNSALLGKGLISNRSNGTVVGLFNDDQPSAVFAVGIGTGENARSTALVVNGNGYIGIGTNGVVGGNAEPISHYTGARLNVSGSWLNASDRRLKSNIEPINYGIHDLMKLQPRTYIVNSSNQRNIGFIAQELKEVVPEAVSGVEGDIKYGETLAVSYDCLVALLTKSIQEQQNEIIDLKRKVEKLEILLQKMVADSDK